VKTKLARLSAAAGLVLAANAHAGTPTPISTLPVLGRPVLSGDAPATSPSGPGVPGFDVVVAPMGSSYTEIRPHAEGTCFVRNDFGISLESKYSEYAGGDEHDVDALRLVSGPGKTTLEQTRLRFEPKTRTLALVGRSSVLLREVARRGDAVAWAYRHGRDVTVVTKTDREASGVQSPQVTKDGFVSSLLSGDCHFAIARLDGRKLVDGAVARIVGRLSPRVEDSGDEGRKMGPRFFVDASLSKVTRDPEPILSVRVRIEDP
jgi:hypothetical protein